MAKKVEHQTDADRAAALLAALSQAYASDYAQAHPDLRQQLLQAAKELDAHADHYVQVRHDLRQILLNLIMVGGIKELDPGLDAVGKIVLAVDNGSLEKTAGLSTIMLPIWFGGKL
ncbi:hypothetical protein [Lacticaseibacillus zhaodongensis]|uniref:hypothetical protein n=1 Tax=Lacticaseibacillus zhaodongensis TaxID=2668065 RepID=UPI0012D2C5D0|nr:hypothetical protein [Lacticaseibacillus zhaodongensis]